MSVLRSAVSLLGVYNVHAETSLEATWEQSSSLWDAVYYWLPDWSQVRLSRGRGEDLGFG